MNLLRELCDAARLRARLLGTPSGKPPRPPPPFLGGPQDRRRLRVIAEFKRRSPSRGALAPDSGLVPQVRLYAEAGAAAISVLTEPTRFGGSLADLEAAAAAVPVPVLMKDFVVDPAQILAGASAGASAVLLIVRCLDSLQLRELAAVAGGHGLSVLVECHDAAEIDLALGIDGAVIGINNRDLETLVIDRRIAPELLPRVPPSRIAIAESGYETPEQAGEVRGFADAVLVGSALMAGGDPAEFIRRTSR